MPQLCSFTIWMQRHAPLVKSLAVDVPQGEVAHPGMIVHGLPMEHHAAAVQQLLQQMLQLAAAAPESATSASSQLAPAAAAATTTWLCDMSVRAQQQQQQEQQQRRLRLVAFSSNMLASSRMLAVLPAHSLTWLRMQFAFSTSSLNGPVMSAALAQLSNLQQLQLGSGFGRKVPGSCLAGIAQLSRLTTLTLTGTWSALDESLQQLLAHPLPLRQLRLQLQCPWGSEPVLQLAGQTQLTEFIYSKDLLEETVLPQQLRHLECSQLQDDSILTVLKLQQLQRLKFSAESVDPSMLLQLAQLPTLQQLALVYQDIFFASQAAPFWTQLPQLCELTVDNQGVRHRRLLPRVLAGIAAATSLTKLVLDGWAARWDERFRHEEDVADAHGAEGEDVRGVDIATCASLSRLPRLRHLEILPMSTLPPGDALALTALTGLTHLALQQLGSGVDDVTASALACHLKQLRHLDLSGNMLGSMACLAPIGQLTQLTELQLRELGGLTARGLMLLTGLTALQKLEVQHSTEVTDKVLTRFWAAVG
jgi:hypothetical protein